MIGFMFVTELATWLPIFTTVGTEVMINSSWNVTTHICNLLDYLLHDCLAHLPWPFHASKNIIDCNLASPKLWNKRLQNALMFFARIDMLFIGEDKLGTVVFKFARRTPIRTIA